MDEAIIEYLKKTYNLMVGERTAEDIKIKIGSAYPLPEEKVMTVRGRNLVTGLPEAVDISSIEIREALANSVSTIVDTVKTSLDETPPELIADLMETGVVLGGGGAQLQGLAQRLTEETQMRCWVAPDPLTCVAVGAGKVLEGLDVMKVVLTSTNRYGMRYGSAPSGGGSAFK
jgi:rod shape-determining protein MreB